MTISPDAIIHPGCRIEDCSMGPGCEIGAEGPVVMTGCQLGRNVELKAGFFNGSAFLDGSSLGAGAHVRAGTILEEQANGAHTVGLKQTILLPFVTLGSLINFCDVLMAGGTSRKNHSEVGSSYVHFNFTPNQDKATASLVGDVPRGVLLNERPIFLGGQGGLTGPSRIAYGSIIAAGSVCRTDLLDENQLHVPPAPPEKTVPFEPGRYGRPERILENNLIYIGNIRALKAWYQQIRMHFIRDEYDEAVLQGALANLDLILNERLQRLEQWMDKVETLEINMEPLAALCRETAKEPESRDLIKEIEAADKSDYIAAIQHLASDAREAATAWLQGIVEETTAVWNGGSA